MTDVAEGEIVEDVGEYLNGCPLISTKPTERVGRLRPKGRGCASPVCAACIPDNPDHVQASVFDDVDSSPRTNSSTPTPKPTRSAVEAATEARTVSPEQRAPRARRMSIKGFTTRQFPSTESGISNRPPSTVPAVSPNTVVVESARATERKPMAGRPPIAAAAPTSSAAASTVAKPKTTAPPTGPPRQPIGVPQKDVNGVTESRPDSAAPRAAPSAGAATVQRPPATAATGAPARRSSVLPAVSQSSPRGTAPGSRDGAAPVPTAVRRDTQVPSTTSARANGRTPLSRPPPPAVPEATLSLINGMSNNTNPTSSRVSSASSSRQTPQPSIPSPAPQSGSTNTATMVGSPVTALRNGQRPGAPLLSPAHGAASAANPPSAPPAKAAFTRPTVSSAGTNTPPVQDSRTVAAKASLAPASARQSTVLSTPDAGAPSAGKETQSAPLPEKKSSAPSSAQPSARVRENRSRFTVDTGGYIHPSASMVLPAPPEALVGPAARSNTAAASASASTAASAAPGGDTPAPSRRPPPSARRRRPSKMRRSKEALRSSSVASSLASMRQSLTNFFASIDDERDAIANREAEEAAAKAAELKANEAVGSSPPSGVYSALDESDVSLPDTVPPGELRASRPLSTQQLASAAEPQQRSLNSVRQSLRRRSVKEPSFRSSINQSKDVPLGLQHEFNSHASTNDTADRVLAPTPLSSNAPSSAARGGRPPNPTMSTAKPPPPSLNVPPLASVPPTGPSSSITSKDDNDRNEQTHATFLVPANTAQGQPSDSDQKHARRRRSSLMLKKGRTSNIAEF